MPALIWLCQAAGSPKGHDPSRCQKSHARLVLLLLCFHALSRAGLIRGPGRQRRPILPLMHGIARHAETTGSRRVGGRASANPAEYYDTSRIECSSALRTSAEREWAKVEVWTLVRLGGSCEQTKQHLKQGQKDPVSQHLLSPPFLFIAGFPQRFGTVNPEINLTVSPLLYVLR